MGECPLDHIIHANCPNVESKIRYAGRLLYYCAYIPHEKSPHRAAAPKKGTIQDWQRLGQFRTASNWLHLKMRTQ